MKSSTTFLALAGLSVLLTTVLPQNARAGEYYRTYSYTRTTTVPAETIVTTPRIIEQPAVITTPRFIEQPAVIEDTVPDPIVQERVIQQPAIIQRTIEKPAVIDRCLESPVVIEERRNHLLDLDLMNMIDLNLF